MRRTTRAEDVAVHAGNEEPLLLADAAFAVGMKAINGGHPNGLPMAATSFMPTWRLPNSNCGRYR